VTVIFVFAINIAGEEASDTRSLVPRPLAWALMGLFLFLLLWLTIPRVVFPSLSPDSLSFMQAVWEERLLDTVLQVALIFSGVLGSLGLLAERPAEEHAQAAAGGQGAQP